MFVKNMKFSLNFCWRFFWSGVCFWVSVFGNRVGCVRG